MIYPLLMFRLSHTDIRLPLPEVELNDPGTEFEFYANKPNCTIHFPSFSVVGLTNLETDEMQTKFRINVLQNATNGQVIKLQVSDLNGKHANLNVQLEKLQKVHIKVSSNTIYQNQSIDFFSITGISESDRAFDNISYSIIRYNTKPQKLHYFQSNPINSTVINNSVIYFKGIHTGKEDITVQYGNLTSNTAEINILPSLITEDKLFLMPKSHAAISLRNKYFQEYKLKNFLYQVDNITVCDCNKGVIKAKAIGNTHILVKFDDLPWNYLKILICVCAPTSISIKSFYHLVGTQISCDEIIIMYNNNKIFYPRSTNIKIGEYNSSYEHEELVNISALGFNSTTKVKFRNVMKVNLTYVRLPVGQHGFIFPVTGGSNHYNITIDDSSVAKIFDGVVYTLKPGKTTAKIVDRKLKTHIECPLEVEEILSAKFNLERFEMRIGEKIIISYYALGLSGQQFSYFKPLRISVSNLSVINEDFICIGAGFTRIKMHFGDSNSTELISVVDPLSTITELNGYTNNNYDLKIQGGPLHWKSAEPPVNTMICGEYMPKFNLDRSVVFTHPYSGICTLRITNDATENNPKPITEEINISVNIHKISKSAIVVTDDLASDYNDCGLVPKYLDDALEFLRVWKLRIPFHHIPCASLYVFDEKGQNLGKYQNNYTITALKQQSGKKLPLPLTDGINETVTFSFKGVKISQTGQFDVPPATIVVEPIFNLTVPNRIYTYKPNTTFESDVLLDVKGGSGNYIVIDRSIVKDKCVPDFIAEAEIIEEIPHKLSIIGNHHVGVDRSINLSLEFRREDETPFEPNCLKYCNPTINDMPLVDGHYTFTPKEPGKYLIKASACGFEAFHNITAFERLYIAQKEITVMPGEKINITFIRGPSEDATFVSEDGSIVSSALMAMSPGTTTITAYVKDRPEFGTEKVKVHVLNITGIALKPSATEVIVGSMISVDAYLAGDKNLIPVSEVKWTVTPPVRFSVHFGSITATFPTDGNFNIHASYKEWSGTVSITVHPELVVESALAVTGTTLRIKSNGKCSNEIIKLNEEGTQTVSCFLGFQTKNATFEFMNAVDLTAIRDGRNLEVFPIDRFGRRLLCGKNFLKSERNGNKIEFKTATGIKRTFEIPQKVMDKPSLLLVGETVEFKAASDKLNCLSRNDICESKLSSKGHSCIIKAKKIGNCDIQVSPSLRTQIPTFDFIQPKVYKNGNHIFLTPKFSRDVPSDFKQTIRCPLADTKQFGNIFVCFGNVSSYEAEFRGNSKVFN